MKYALIAILLVAGANSIYSSTNGNVYGRQGFTKEIYIDGTNGTGENTAVRSEIIHSCFRTIGNNFTCQKKYGFTGGLQLHRFFL
jgi:hypothetical protein